MEFENWNVKAKSTGIAFRKLITDQIPDEAVRRISMHQEYADNRDWIAALRPAVRDEKDFQEGKRLQDNNLLVKFKWEEETGRTNNDKDNEKT